jgi:hypothetical protein
VEQKNFIWFRNSKSELMKKFFKKLTRTKLGIKVRQTLGIRPSIFTWGENEVGVISDLFFWKTDEGFSTRFRASDIIGKYYNLASTLVLVFFDNKGNEILKEQFSFGETNQLTVDITHSFVGYHGIGTFCAFNVVAEKPTKNIFPINRCYVGYGFDDFYSMVHGNLPALITHPVLEKKSGKNNMVIRPTMTKRKGDYSYYLQLPNISGEQLVLVFTNPIDRRIRISVGDMMEVIDPFGCSTISVSQACGLIRITSDFIFPRPIVFRKSKSFFDVSHG